MMSGITSPHFEGRMKTVREKVVTPTHESRNALWGNNRNEQSILVPSVVTAVPVSIAGGGLLVPLLPSVAPEVVVTGSGVAYLGGVTGWAYAEDFAKRKITYVEKQVPMTQEEEWAVMTPLERANVQVDQALSKWQGLRTQHEQNIKEVQQCLQTLQTELTALDNEYQPLLATLKSLKDKPPAEQLKMLKGESLEGYENKVNQLKIRLDAKHHAQVEQLQLLEMARKVYQNLNGEILLREQKLYETRESLKVMSQRSLVLSMHKDWKGLAGKEGAAGNLALSGEITAHDTAQEAAIMLALEKQKVEIEALMASVQTAMDVESVLKATP